MFQKPTCEDLRRELRAAIDLAFPLCNDQEGLRWLENSMHEAMIELLGASDYGSRIWPLRTEAPQPQNRIIGHIEWERLFDIYLKAYIEATTEPGRQAALDQLRRIGLTDGDVLYHAGRKGFRAK